MQIDDPESLPKTAEAPRSLGLTCLEQTDKIKSPQMFFRRAAYPFTVAPAIFARQKVLSKNLIGRSLQLCIAPIAGLQKNLLRDQCS